MSANGRYRIPNDNPFVKTKGARPEIWAYGLRNPHRLAWAPDPSNPRGTKLIANSVGYRTWETVNFIERGSNHGWPYREGNQVLSPDQRSHGPLPEVDKIPTQIGDEITDQVVTPKYPVIQYGHDPAGGDAIGSGYVYNGKLIPALRGKYIFGDITTGPLLVRRLQRDAGRGCRRQTRHGCQALRGEVSLGQPERLTGFGQADLRRPCSPSMR